MGSSKTDVKKFLQNEVTQIIRAKASSTIHNPSRDALAAALRMRIGSLLPWGFLDPEYSDFPVAGDLMAYVEEVETEYTMKTPFGVEYRFDIALLGPTLRKRRVVLGAIELELENEFESAKCLISKCLGFPLLSLDIKATESGPIDGDQLLAHLLETTYTSDDERRRNFFYLHPSLYPVYLKLPQKPSFERRHQFVIFAEPERLNKIYKSLELLRETLNLSNQQVSIQRNPNKNIQQLKQFENEGSIAGLDWRSYNPSEYIRISLDRPVPGDRSCHLFHLTMARIVNSDIPALVGYKYEPGIYNDSPDEPIWTRHYCPPGEPLRTLRVAPKHLSQPIEAILKILSEMRSRRNPSA